MTKMNSSPLKRAAVSPARTALREPLAQLPEHGVPHLVAEAVVHDLEPVEVQEQHGDVGAASARAHQFLVQAVEEQGPVGQAGDVVVESLVSESLLRLDLLADVLDRSDIAVVGAAPLGAADNRTWRTSPSGRRILNMNVTACRVGRRCSIRARSSITSSGCTASVHPVPIKDSTSGREISAIRALA